MNAQQVFATIAIAFNNEEVLVTMPDDAYDLPNIEIIDLNDMSRIKITRDCAFHLVTIYFHHFNFKHSTNSTALLHNISQGYGQNMCGRQRKLCIRLR